MRPHHLPVGFTDPQPLTPRQRIEAEIERLIDLLDAFDGDPDFETETGLDHDTNPVTLNPDRRMPARRVTMLRSA